MATGYTTIRHQLKRWLYRKGVPLLDMWGISFDHNGDSVIWIWPWKRQISNNKPFYSISFEGFFDTLYDLELEWFCYFTASAASSYRWRKEKEDA